MLESGARDTENIRRSCFLSWVFIVSLVIPRTIVLKGAAECCSIKTVGEPYALIGPVRFDEGDEVLDDADGRFILAFLICLVPTLLISDFECPNFK